MKMSKVQLAAELRTGTGSNDSGRLRAVGKIPAVLYGGENIMHITIDAVEFIRNFKTVSENTIIDLAIGKDVSKEVLVKGYQVDKVKGQLIHLDFYEILRGKKLHTRIPLTLTGTPVGVKNSGGLLEHNLHEFQIECLPKDIPAYIEVDVSGLEINQAIHASDVVMPEGVDSLEAEDTVIALVTGKPLDVDLEVSDEEAEVEDPANVPVGAPEKEE